MASYSLLTTWVIGAPRERVWEAIWDGPSWPQWWPGVLEVVELEPGGERGVGRYGRFRWRAPLPYEVEFHTRVTAVDPPRYMAGSAEGELSGIGRWHLFEEGGATAVVYRWDVVTTRAWMNLLAPVARPVFVRSHDWLMRQGGRGLAGRLGAELIAAG